MEWLIQNMGTIIPAALVLGVSFLAARSIWRNKKAGKCCGCSNGGGCSCCHGKEERSRKTV